MGADHQGDRHKSAVIEDVRDIFARNGIAAAGGSAQEMDKYFKDEIAMWAGVVRDAGLERLQM